MRTQIIFVYVFMAMTGITVAAPADRFKGGSHDGYDRNCFLQTHDRARFKGGSHDGYDNSRTNAVSFPCTLTVVSDHGAATPVPGVLTTNCGTLIDASVVTPELVGVSTQYVSTGWTGAGSVTNGIGTNTSFMITNNSTLTWLWTTNYWLDTGVSGSGEVNVADSWILAGSDIAITATASNHWHFTGWSGQTGGCALAGNVITAAMSQVRVITADFAIDQHVLTVVSAYGGQNPGTTTNSWGAGLSCYLTNSPVWNGTTQYVGNGGTVLSNDFNQVNLTNVTLTLTNNAVLTWRWTTNYWLTVDTSNCTVSVTNGFYGTNITISATPTIGYHFVTWIGDTNGCTTNANSITVPMTQNHTITAVCAIDMFNITASAGPNGTILPSGAIAVTYGGNTNFVITPNAFYYILDVTVDSISVGPSNSYMFVNVTNNRSILSAFGANMTTNGHPTPEWWLNQYYGVTDYTAVAEQDTDGDGMLTWAEYVAGTDPTNCLSVLAITMPDLVYGSNYYESVTEDTNFIPSVWYTQRIYEVIGHKVSWPSVTGRVYNLAFGTNLVSNVWSIVDGASNIAANPPQNTFTNETSSFSNKLMFYRVKVTGP